MHYYDVNFPTGKVETWLQINKNIFKLSSKLFIFLVGSCRANSPISDLSSRKLDRGVVDENYCG